MSIGLCKELECVYVAIEHDAHVVATLRGEINNILDQERELRVSNHGASCDSRRREGGKATQTCQSANSFLHLGPALRTKRHTLSYSPQLP